MKKDNFVFHSAKVTAEGVAAVFDEKITVEGDPKMIKWKPDSSIPPHKDLLDLVKQLRETLIDAYGFYEGLSVAEKYLKGEQKKKILDAKAEVLSSVIVSKVSLSGSDQLRGVVISGKKKDSWNGGYMALNSPRIVFSSDKIGNEKEVERIVDLIEIEVFKYFYNQKYGNPTLFNQDEGKSSEGLKKVS